MKHQWLLLGSCVLCLGMTSGCSQDHDGNISPTITRVEVHKDQHAELYTSHDLKQEMLAQIAADYKRNGDGTPLTLTVQYDPSSSQNTAINATNHATKLAKGLREAGVSNVKSEIMPVLDVGHHSKTLVTYNRYSAHAPEACEGNLMPGLNTTTDWKANRDYEYGCSVESQIAKQISRPSDLLGREGFDTPDDGRRAANIIELHRTGAPNEPLTGETATEE